MALREIISRRLWPLRRAGIKTPILNQLPLKAKILHMEIVQSSLDWRAWMDEILRRIRGPPPPTPKIPTIIKGLVRGDEAGRWYEVTFPRPLKNAVITATSNARITDYLKRVIPRVEKQPLTEIVRIARDDFNSPYYCDLVGAGARDRAKTLAPPWPLDLVWNWFCNTLVYSIFYAGWWAAGWILNVLYDAFVQPQIDKVRDSIHQHITAAFTGVQEQIDAVRDAINERLSDLMTMWGVPYGTDQATALTVPMLRNVSDSGFEFLSLGNMDVWFTAVGDPE